MLFLLGGKEEESREGTERALQQSLASGSLVFMLPVASCHQSPPPKYGLFYALFTLLLVQGAERHNQGFRAVTSPLTDAVHADDPWSEQITFQQRRTKRNRTTIG